MQLNRVALLLLAVFVMTGGCKSTTDENNKKTVRAKITDPLVYDSRILAELTHVNQGLFGILEQISAADSVGIMQEYYRTTQHLDEGIKQLNLLSALNGNTAYRNAALKIMQFHRNTMDKEYKRIVEISVKKKPSIREEEERETLYEKMENVEEKLDEQILRIREKFGEENEVKLPSEANLQL